MHPYAFQMSAIFMFFVSFPFALIPVLLDLAQTETLSFTLGRFAGQRGSLGAVGASEPAKDDSLAAMEKFAAQAAARDQEKADREAAVPLLNETSFDRRRVMAVYKEDGTRGHHMQVTSLITTIRMVISRLCFDVLYTSRV